MLPQTAPQLVFLCCLFLQVYDSCWKRETNIITIVNYSHIQQNSINPVSINPEVPIIWYLRRVDPRPEVLLLTRKMLHQRNRLFTGMCSNKSPRGSVH